MKQIKEQGKVSLNSFSISLRRPAFTLIELLIAISILSVTFVYVLRIHSDNKKHILYLSERNKNSLEDSLYLSKNILRHHKNKRTAYEIIQSNMRIKEDDSRTILKKSTRNIFIPEEIKIIPPPESRGPTAIVNEIKLKDKHSSIYWHFKIQSF